MTHWIQIQRPRFRATFLILLVSITGGCSAPGSEDREAAVIDPTMTQVDSLLGRQQFADALHVLRESLAERGGSVDLHVATGNTHAHLGVLDSATAHYRAAVAIDSQCADAWHNLGIILADKGQHHEAVDAVQHAVDADTSFAAGYETLGLLAMKVGDYPRAEAALIQSSKVGRSLSTFRTLGQLQTRLGNYAGAQLSLAQALAIDSLDTEALRLLGLLHLAKGHADSAVQVLQQSTRLDPLGTEGFYNLAGALRAVGDEIAAEAAMTQFEDVQKGAADIARVRRLLDADPGDIESRLRLAHLYRQRGDEEQMGRHLQAALAHAPDHVEARLQLSHLYERRRDPRTALSTLLQRPAETDARWTFAVGYLQLTMRDLQGARVHLDQTLTLEPAHAQALNNLGNVNLLENLYDDARRCFTKALATPAPPAEAAMNLATLLVHDGKNDSALVYYERALRIDPAASRAHLAIGALHEQAGELAKAAGAYERYLQSGTPDPRHAEQARQGLARTRQGGTAP